MAITANTRIDSGDYEKKIIELQTAMAGITAAEEGVLDGVTPGTAAASKALVLNSSSGITTGLTLLTATTVTATTANATTVNATTVAAAGKVSTTSPSAGVGYSTGAGGVATQASNKSTTAAAVPDPSACGSITMNNAALNAGVIVSFTFTNSAIAATDVLVLNHISGGTVGSYTLNAQCAAGSATINVRNNTGGNLSEAIVIQYVIVKGVNA